MMASKRSAINCLSWAQVFTAFVLIYAARILHGYTNPADVAAINCLYAALGSPSLPGWVPNGGDPCTESWQGVLCNNTDISSIILTDANLGGELGDCLSSFSSIEEIQLGNNNIRGSIPSNLPVTLQTLSLDGNQLIGEIPDVFQGLIGFFNLDLSSNNLNGQLPPSLENLSYLTTLHLQNNQLSGTLDVLQDLALKDLNIENNLFNGPIPDKLLSIPNFKKDGNPFTPLPSPTSPTTPPPAPPFSGPPCSGKAPGGKADGPCEESNAKRCKKTTNRVVWISTAGAVSSFIILVLTILRSMPRRPELPILFVPVRVPMQSSRSVRTSESSDSNPPTPTCPDVPQCTCPPSTRASVRCSQGCACNDSLVDPEFYLNYNSLCKII